MSTTYDMEKRYGIRDARHLTSAFRIFGRVCVLVHVLCVIGLGVVAADEIVNHPRRAWGNVPTTLELVIGMGTMTCLFMNRPAMYLALRILLMIEAAVSDSRTQRSRGWKGKFVDAFSMSLLLPPGDILAVALLVMMIRSNTDHLDERQFVIFQRSESALGIGAVLQYVGFFMFISWPYFARTADAGALIILAIVAHLTMFSGVVTVDWSLTVMQGNLSGIVLLKHAVEDTTGSFLANLCVDKPEELPRTGGIQPPHHT